jgi:phosphatidylserine decarboxylase
MYKFILYHFNKANRLFNDKNEAIHQITLFAKQHNIKIEPALLEKPICEYTSINDFFMRKYVNIEIANTQIIHPATATLCVFENIDSIPSLIKGEKYDSNRSGIPNINEFNTNRCLYYYLSPSDYHCFHSPISGVVEDIVDLSQITNNSLSVKPYMLGYQQSILTYNRRYIIIIKQEHCKIAMIIIGGFCVDSIRIDKQIQPNASIEKGQYIGAFALGGSAIIMLSNKEIDFETQRMNDIPIKFRACSGMGSFSDE